MALHMSYFESQIKEIHADLNRCYRKIGFWKRLLFMSMLAAVLSAAIAFFVSFTSVNRLLVITLIVSMFVFSLFIVLSVYKVFFWTDQADRHSLLLPSTERALQAAAEKTKDDSGCDFCKSLE